MKVRRPRLFLFGLLVAPQAGAAPPSPPPSAPPEVAAAAELPHPTTTLAAVPATATLEPPAAAPLGADPTDDPLVGPEAGATAPETALQAELSPAPTPPVPSPTQRAVTSRPQTGEPVAAPPDEVSGHVTLGLRTGGAFPFGEVSSGVDQRRVSGAGLGFGLDAGVGLARDVSVGAYGDLLLLAAGTNCADCRPTSYGAGLFVRYHLVQGLRFDPWASFGVGLRGLSSGGPGASANYLGLEWLRVTFGGDWHVSRWFGVGPYLELGAGSFWTRPDGEDPLGVHWRGQLGLRGVIDLPGR